MVSERTYRLFEARMRDIRHHQKKAASGAVIGRKFKEAYQALGALSGALMTSKRQDLAREVDDIEGMIRRVQKEVA